MAKTNYSKMAKVKEDVTPIMETTSLDAKPVVEETVVVNTAAEETIAEKVVEKKPEPKIKKGVVINCLKLNVRTNPSSNATIALTIDKGAEVEIVGSTGDFYNVRGGTVTEGFSGWCMKKYISIK